MSKGGRRLRLSNDAAMFVRSLHPELKRKMKAALQVILDKPDSGKALKRELSGLHGFRVGRFRLVYRSADDNIEIVAVGPRKTIYEETYRRVIEKKR